MFYSEIRIFSEGLLPYKIIKPYIKWR